MTRFDFFGYTYEVIDETKKEVRFLKVVTAGQLKGRVIIPHTLELKGLSYKVTSIGPRQERIYRWFEGVRETDKRKKNIWKEGQEPKWVPNESECVSPFVYHDGKGKSSDEKLRVDTAITSVVLPDSITSIGEGAFRRCHALKEVNLPKTIRGIGCRAFMDLYH